MRWVGGVGAGVELLWVVGYNMLVSPFFKILKVSQVAHNIMVWGGKMGMGADGGLQCLVE